MKKTYQNPKTKIVTISVTKMFATSNKGYGAPEQGQDLSEAETTTVTNNNLSRRRDMWDEEEEW
ncbi:MAG: hypothetical protein IJ887_13690 [Prevotella sp.]|nr:hypothetical protein [Prevotella sp.]MBR6188223.1 hypothetical protein [Prevotella sp.]